MTDFFWPDKSADPAAVKQFYAWCAEDDKKYWNMNPMWKNRWHIRSVSVAPEWQNKGIGKALTRKVIERAKEEGVVVGLEASPQGYEMYKPLGFRLLGRFCETPTGGEGGGVMIWEPQGE